MTGASETLRWRELDARHHIHPFTDHAALAARGSRIITRAEGCWLWDSEGNRLLDGMAGLWCVNVGYGRAELVEAARRQMATLPYYNTFFQSSTPAAIELAARLAELAPGLDRVFFTNSGSEANDTAIKLVRYFWNLQGRPTKKIVISRAYGYHGVTLATASLSGLAAMHAQADLPLPGFEHVDGALLVCARRRPDAGGAWPAGRAPPRGAHPRARARTTSPPSSASRSRVRAA